MSFRFIFHYKISYSIYLSHIYICPVCFVSDIFTLSLRTTFCLLLPPALADWLLCRNIRKYSILTLLSLKQVSSGFNSITIWKASINISQIAVQKNFCHVSWCNYRITTSNPSFFNTHFRTTCLTGTTIIYYVLKSKLIIHPFVFIWTILWENEAHLCSKFKNNPSLGRRSKS